MQYLIFLLLLVTSLSITAQTEKLEVDGAINVQKAEGTGVGTIEYNGTLDDFRGRTTSGWTSLSSGGSGGSLWNLLTGDDISYIDGNVAIGGTGSLGSLLNLNGSTPSMLRLENTAADGYMQFYTSAGYMGLVGDEGTDNYFDIKSRSSAQGISMSTNTTEHALRVLNNGKIDLVNSIEVGDEPPGSSPTAGTIRWSGIDFEGYDGSNWKSLTKSVDTNNFQYNIWNNLTFDERSIDSPSLITAKNYRLGTILSSEVPVTAVDGQFFAVQGNIPDLSYRNLDICIEILDNPGDFQAAFIDERAIFKHNDAGVPIAYGFTHVDLTTSGCYKFAPIINMSSGLWRVEMKIIMGPQDIIRVNSVRWVKP